MQQSLLAWACAVGTAAAAAYYLWPAAAWRVLHSSCSQDDDDVPDEFKDPITYEIISDPVILCATGQVYDYQSLRRWLSAGNYRCPRTNLELVDAQVTRLPWLRDAILNWLTQHDMPLPPDPHPSLAGIEASHPEIAACIRSLRTESGQERLTATMKLAYKLRQWQDSTFEDDDAARMQHADVRAAVMDDLLWMLRYGDCKLQGAAASCLACCQLVDELSWLAATAVVPLVAMLSNGSKYAQEWALQVLYKICLAVAPSRPLLWRAGCVAAMLALISRPQAMVGFHRDRAAVAVATLAEIDEVKTWLRRHGVLPLMTLLLTTTDRWEQRDAAFALMALQLDSKQLQTAAAEVLAQHSPPALGSSRHHNSHNAAGTPPAQARGGDATDEADNGANHFTAATENTDAVVSAVGPAGGSGGDSTATLEAGAENGAATRTALASSGPCQELLQVGLDHVHELLGRYRWCSQQYLQGQSDAPDAGLTDAELAERHNYEAALARYRQAVAGQQQQAAAVIEAEIDLIADEQLHAQQQQQQREHDDVMDIQHDAQQQQQVELEQQQPQQQDDDDGDAVAAPAVPLVQPPHQHEHGPRRRSSSNRRRQQQPRHWMAEHDADDAFDNSASGSNGLADMMSGGSSSSSSDESQGDESSEDTASVTSDDMLPLHHPGR